MKKQTLLANVIFLTLVFSSGLDRAVAQNNNASADPDGINKLPCRVTEIIDRGNFDVHRNVFEWSGGRITKVEHYTNDEDIGHRLIEYSNGKISSVKTYVAMTGTLSTTLNVEHGPNGQWSKITRTDENCNIVATATYQDGLRTNIVYEEACFDFVRKKVYTYSYQDGNLVKAVTESYEDGPDSEPFTTVMTFEYGDKVNLAAPLEEFLNIVLFIPGPTPSRNYAAKRVRSYLDEEEDSEEVFEASYSVNEHGLPTVIESDEENLALEFYRRTRTYRWACH